MNSNLSFIKNYLGVISIDLLKKVEIHEFPAIFCVNLDYSYEIGSHWIAIRVSSASVEIFDSLGLHFSRYPKPLIDFISKYGKSKFVKTTPVLQPINSILCGYYVIYYIISRQKTSFKSCLRPFCSDLNLNDRVLLSFLNAVVTKL